MEPNTRKNIIGMWHICNDEQPDGIYEIGFDLMAEDYDYYDLHEGEYAPITDCPRCGQPIEWSDVVNGEDVALEDKAIRLELQAEVRRRKAEAAACVGVNTDDLSLGLVAAQREAIRELVGALDIVLEDANGLWNVSAGPEGDPVVHQTARHLQNIVEPLLTRYGSTKNLPCGACGSTRVQHDSAGFGYCPDCGLSGGVLPDRENK